VFAIKDFRLDKLIFVRDTLFYMAAVTLLFYIFNGPGRIRLQDSICLLGLYLLYVMVVLASKYFTKDRPLKNLHGPSKKELEETGGIEFEGVYIDDDPTASMVVMRRFLFYDADALPPQPAATSLRLPPSLKIDKTDSSPNGTDSTSANGANDNTLTVATQKSSRRVTLFEGETTDRCGERSSLL
jgi:Ca2+/Na+ antiporter